MRKQIFDLITTKGLSSYYKTNDILPIKIELVLRLKQNYGALENLCPNAQYFLESVNSAKNFEEISTLVENHIGLFD